MQRLRVPAAILVGCVWTLAFLMGAATKDYTALAYTTPVVVLAATAIFAMKNGNHRNGGPR